MIYKTEKTKLVGALVSYFGEVGTLDDVAACSLCHTIEEDLKKGKYNFLPDVLRLPLGRYYVAENPSEAFEELQRLLGRSFLVYDAHEANALIALVKVSVDYNVLLYVVKVDGFQFMKAVPTNDSSESLYEFRLFEMFMQMNYRQIQKVCPFCAMAGEEHCGHLTFTTAI